MIYGFDEQSDIRLKNTIKLLKAAEHYGEHLIGILNADHPKFNNASFHNSPTRPPSIFGIGKTSYSSPLIWSIVKMSGLGAGCGNTNQYQAKLTPETVLAGVWEYKNNKWVCITSAHPELIGLEIDLEA